ncbi:MAG: hypothetical protein O3C40_19595 [Planctomycetota bacterium]|nr:hypothetical protein [Planctomycetota bacterium]
MFPRITSCLLGTSCLAAVIFARPARCDAQLPRQRPAATGARQSFDQPNSQEATARPEGQIRLNHVQSRWRRVLEELAKSMNVALVMPDEPPGFYSRFDRTLHTHTEAIRILNREIEEKGFRLVAKGDYLLVLELDAGRVEYERPIIAARPRQPGMEGAGATMHNSPASSSNMRRLPPTQVEPGRQSPVRQAGFLSTTSSAAGNAQILRLAMRQQRADFVAERLFQACRDWATPTGQPHQPLSFRIDLRGTGSAPVQIAVTTDLPKNELVLQTPPQLADAVTRLVRSFDTQKIRPGTSERLIAGVDDVASVARQVQTPLNGLRLQQRTQRVAARQLPEPTATPTVAPRQNPSNALETIEQLRGDVTVEVIEDLGVLILRGDSNDVDAVAKLVAEIAKLGVGAAPEIHLLMLSFVNSESLTELLKGVFERPKSFESAASVSIIPVRSPNAVLIVAPAALMPVVLELADKLDQPGDPRSVFRVFALKQAVATQVLELLEDFYEPKGGLAARIKAVVDVRTNSLIVQGAPRDLDEVAALIQRIDHDESKAVSQMRIFPLRNAVAEELVDVINTALRSALSDPLNQPAAQAGTGASSLSGGGAGERAVGGAGSSRRSQSAKSVVLQFLAADGVNREQIRSGILSDIRASADPRTNSLVVTAPEQSMALMAELIRQLDTPTAMVAEIKVFTLANADATAMGRLLETLFSSPAQQQRLGVQIAGAEDASSSLIPMKFSVDVRTNSILATGGAEALRVMEAILLRLDQSDLRQRRSVVYKLRNSPARDVADAINQFLASRRDVAQVDPNLVSTVEQVEREVIVVPELVSNSLLISATPRHYDEILELTEQLDQPPPQVIIQALLVEVVLSNNDEFGVELGVQDSVLFNRSAISDLVTITNTMTPMGLPQTTTQQIISQAAVPGFNFNNQPLGNNPANNTSAVGTQGLSSFSLGRVNSDLGYGGMVLSAGSESVNVLVRALAAKRKIDVLSRPQIRTLDNQLATIQVGQQVPIVDGVAVSGTGSANPVVRQDQAGVILSVTPRISPDEVIVMEVSAEKSQYTGQGVPLFTDANNGNVIESPIKDIIKASTTISVPNGQTVVLGGMITTLDVVNERKVPWLGDVPVIGRAFRYDSVSSRRTELLIFLTPRVVHNSVDSEMIKQVEAARLHYVEHAAEAVHGPLFGVPEEPGLQPYELPPGPRDVPIENLELGAPSSSRRMTPTLADPTQP